MTDAIDLTTEQRNQLTALLRRFLPGVTVWAYGSRVKWTARPNSDLDLVAFTTPAQQPQVADLKDALAESNLPFPVDLHVWDEVPERFRDIIRKEYVVMQEVKQQESSLCGLGMAGEWREIKLGDAIELKRGYDLPSRDRRDGPFPIVSSSGISGCHTEAKAKAPGVVIGRYGTLGAVHYVTKDYWPLNTALYVRDFKGNDPRFIGYFLRSLDFTAYSDKAAVPGLNRNDLHTAQVLLPPFDDQRAIAHILGTLDDKIELNRRMNETLEAIARALFESWFIRFDPVRRNMARKGRGQPSPGASRPPLPVGEVHYRGGYDFSGLVETARDLRARQTPAETICWELVRDRQFMGLKFRRQHQLGDYIADFYCHEHRLVIELDGGIHSAKHQKDHKRDAWMEAQEFTVLRFRNEQLIEDPESVLTAIAEIIQAAPTHSLPLGEGRGEGVVAGALPSPSGRGAGGESMSEAFFRPLPLGEGRGEGVVAGEAYDHLFPDSFEDSELGEIPRGWSIGSLGDFSFLNPESWSKDTWPEVIKYVDLANTKWGRIEVLATYAKKDAPSRAQRVLRVGDTIVGTVRPGNGSYALGSAPLSRTPS